MAIQHFITLMETMEPNVRRHFARATGLDFQDDESEFRNNNWEKYRMMRHIVNESTIKNNRYFHLTANFVEAFDWGNSWHIKKFERDNPLPEYGSGWRKIRRWLKKFEASFIERMLEYKMNEKVFGHLNLGGKFIDGEEFAQLCQERQLCNRWNPPREWGYTGWLLMDDGVLVEVEYDKNNEVYRVYEIQGVENNWCEDDMLSYFKERTEVGGEWEWVLEWWNPNPPRLVR